MSIRVTTLAEDKSQQWEEYVSAHPCGTFFHTLIWRDAVAEAFGHESHYLVAWRDNVIAGVFPLTRVRSHLAGTLLISVPYAVYGGSLADNDEVHEALRQSAIGLATSMNANWLDIRSVRAQWPDMAVVNRYVTFRKRLPDDPGQVLGTLPRKARAAARQARDKHNLVARFDDHLLDRVWSLYSQSMRRLASPNYPVRFFEALVRRTCPAGSTGQGPGHLVQMVEHDGRPVAGLLSFTFRGTLMPYFVGSDERFEKYHPNNFLYLSAMEQGVRTGCRKFDFGRTRIDNQGAYNFKRFQGFEPTPLEYQYYTPPGGRTPDLTPDNARLKLARSIWPRLPLSVTRPLGSWLAKSIPG